MFTAVCPHTIALLSLSLYLVSNTYLSFKQMNNFHYKLEKKAYRGDWKEIKEICVHSDFEELKEKT